MKDSIYKSFVEYQRPPLVKLTQIGGNPQIDGGEPTIAYVDASAIAMVSRGYGGFKFPDKPELMAERNSSHTVVWLHGGQHLLCLEPPDVVAMRRERALNNSVKPEVVGGDQ